MPFLIDFQLCQRVLDAAVEARGKPVSHGAIEEITQLVFSNEDRFVTQLRDSPVPFEIERLFKGSKNYVLRSGLIYLHLNTKPHYAIVVPPHYVTDHASVPVGARWIVAQRGDHSAGAVVHDWLYSVGERSEVSSEFRKSRKKADVIFRDAMKASDVGFLKRRILYRSARLAGAVGYGNVEELRFIDPANPAKLLDPGLFDKAALRAFTICPRPPKAYSIER